MSRARRYLREGDVLINAYRGGRCMCIVLNDLNDRHLKRLIFKHPYKAYLGEEIPILDNEQKISAWLDYGWECLLG